MADVPTGIVALLFTDIEGSTRLLRELGPEYPDLLQFHNKTLSSAVAKFGGAELSPEGDAFFALFESVDAAVEAAIAVQLAFKRSPDADLLKVRIGIHAGNVAKAEVGTWGMGLHQAARIAGVPDGREVVLSEAAYALVDELPFLTSVERLGSYKLKDLARSVRVYRVRHPMLDDGSMLTAPVLDHADDTIQNIWRAFDDTRVVTLVGDAASGKASLARAFGATFARSFPAGIWFVRVARSVRSSDLVGLVCSAVDPCDIANLDGVGAIAGYLGPQPSLIIIDGSERFTDPDHPTLECLMDECSELSILCTSDRAIGVRGETVVRVHSNEADPSRRRRRPNIHSSILVPPTPLIGRSEEVEAIKQHLLGDARLVTLTGPGGSGKTRLATEIAILQGDTFSDGAVMVRLEGVTSATFVPDAVARTLGVVAECSETSSDAVIRHLRSNELLLIVDNFEHVLSAASFMAQLVATCPDLRIIVTSRERLRIRAEHVVYVGGLSRPNAIALFHAAAVRSGLLRGAAESAAVDEICRRLDDLPLALELVAASAGLAVTDSFEDLTNLVFDSLDGPRDLLGRHAGLNAAIEWSIGLLEVDARDLFDTLGVFRGSVRLESALHVSQGRSLQVTQRLLRRLADMSLLERSDESGTRFRLPETIREFALQRLSGRVDCTRERHADAVRALVAAATATSADEEYVRAVSDEHDNLAAALDWWAASRQPDVGLEMIVGLSEIWRRQGRWTETEHWLERLLGVVDPVTELWASGASQLGYLQMLRGKDVGARNWMERAVSTWRALEVQLDTPACGPPNRLISSRSAHHAMTALGYLAQRSGHLASALDISERVIASSTGAALLRDHAFALHLRGSVRIELGEVASARSDLGEACRLLRSAGDHEGELRMLFNVGLAARMAGDLVAASEAFGRVSASESRDTRCVGLMGLALIGCEDEEDCAQQALQIAESLGSDDLVAAVHRVLSIIALDHGEFAAAAQHLETVEARSRDSSWQLMEEFLGSAALDVVARRGSGEAWIRRLATVPVPAPARVASCLDRAAAWLALAGRHEDAERCLRVAGVCRDSLGLPIDRADLPFVRMARMSKKEADPGAQQCVEAVLEYVRRIEASVSTCGAANGAKSEPRPPDGSIQEPTYTRRLGI